jgi:sporulation protein YlmC with PRC-barrel domain
MARKNGGVDLVGFDDFDGELEEHWQDAKGRKVVDKSGDEVGSVEDLFIWEEPETVHLLKVSGGDRSFLLPVHAATTVTEEAVEVEQSKETMLSAPEFDEEGVPDAEARRAAYAHYGYPDPLDLGGE